MLPSILELLGNIYHPDLPVAQASIPLLSLDRFTGKVAQVKLELLTVRTNLMTSELISSPADWSFVCSTLLRRANGAARTGYCFLQTELVVRR